MVLARGGRFAATDQSSADRSQPAAGLAIEGIDDQQGDRDQQENAQNSALTTAFYLGGQSFDFGIVGRQPE